MSEHLKRQSLPLAVEGLLASPVASFPVPLGNGFPVSPGQASCPAGPEQCLADLPGETSPTSWADMQGFLGLLEGERRSQCEQLLGCMEPFLQVGALG